MAFSGVAFNTANLVGQVTGWKFELSHWMDQHTATVKATDEQRWAEICAKIAELGFKAVEVWHAHADPSVMTEAKAKTWRKILDDHGLKAIAWAGATTEETVRVCTWLGIPMTAGGLGAGIGKATELCKKYGIKANHENHPEKSAEEIIGRIDGGNEWIGVAVDTGWLGTQGVDAPGAIRKLGKLARHVHLKDVRAKGGHETVALGDGCVNVAGVIAALKNISYTGWLSWEDEPEDRNPFDSAVRNREWIESRIKV